MDGTDLSVELVDSPEKLASFVEWLRSDRETPVALDTETTGLEWWTPGFLRLVQFGRGDGTGWAIPHAWWPRLNEWAVEELNRAATPVVMHNCKFDQHALEAGGLPTIGWHHLHDTKVLHHLADPLAPHSLKPISVEAFGSWAGDGQWYLQQVMRKHGWSWDTVPVDHPVYWGYGVIDTVLTAALFEDGLHAYADSVPYHREMAYQRIMYSAEKRGLVVDVPYAEALRKEWDEDTRYLRQQLQDLGVKNPNSNRQVENALRRAGWEPDAYTETGQALLDKTVLSKLMRTYPHAELLIEYKQKTKWMSTYLDPFISSGGTVHASINTMQARTGRSSITGPPLQTLPHTPHIRNAVLPYEGGQLWAIDYSGQEYRILAALSQDPAWLREFNEGAGDPHQLVADELGTTRAVAKTFNFAVVYGAGKEKLALTAGISVNEVTKFLDIYRNRFPGIDIFKSNLERDTRNNGFRATTRGGRTVQCYEDQLYAITNYVIQGSGADVLKEATCYLDAAGFGDHIMVPVHDELILSLPDEKAAAEAAAIMTNDHWFDVRLPAEAEGPFERWGEAYE